MLSTLTCGLLSSFSPKTRAGVVPTLSTSARAWPGRVTLSADRPATGCPSYVVLSRLSLKPRNFASGEHLPP